MYAIAIDEQSDQLLVASVYKAPWATSSDNKELYKVLESTTAEHNRLVKLIQFFVLSVKQLLST